MPDNRPFSQWDLSPIPVIAFAPGSHSVLYRNSAAMPLAPDTLVEGLTGPESAALCAALDGPYEAPVFLHVGGGVYSLLPILGSGAVTCLFQDVTAYYNRTRDALDQALMASQAKTTFLSEMSHDIRTPMGAIAGLTDIALSQPGSPTKVSECLEKIKVASGHMMSLLNEVLDMSRIESGRVQIQAEPTNIADLLHEILIVAKPQADSGGLQFVLEMGQIARENLVLDSVRLKQVCLNLLSNAVKYTPRGLCVKDNGIGMSREFLMKLFTPFEREEKSSVHKIQGTGLGMTITKNLIELMGGHIEVESETDKGSCFTLDIPFAAAPDPEPDSSLRGCEVLLLDSDNKQASLTLSLLRELGMECDWASTAGDAVSYVNDCDIFGTEYQFLLAAEKLEDTEMTLLLSEPAGPVPAHTAAHRQRLEPDRVRVHPLRRGRLCAAAPFQEQACRHPLITYRRRRPQGAPGPGPLRPQRPSAAPCRGQRAQPGDRRGAYRRVRRTDRLRRGRPAGRGYVQGERPRRL